MELGENQEECTVEMWDMLEDLTEYNPSSTVAIITEVPGIILKADTTDLDLHKFSITIDSKKDLFPNDHIYVPIGTLDYLKDIRSKLVN